jgi:hypothetical protein
VGKLTVLLDGMGILTIADTLALERLCDIYADILQLRLTIADEGEPTPCRPRAVFD